MSSMEVHRPIMIGDTMLVTRRALAVLTERHVNTVRNNCQPIACRLDRSHSGAPVLLYDAEACGEQLRSRERHSDLVA